MDDCPRQDPAYRQLRKGPAPVGPFYMSVPGLTSTPGFATSEVEKPGVDALPRRGVPRKQDLTDLDLGYVRFCSSSDYLSPSWCRNACSADLHVCLLPCNSPPAARGRRATSSQLGRVCPPQRCVMPKPSWPASDPRQAFA